jgi:hypothetical protein
MLLDYAYSDYSADMWSFGCILASMIFRRWNVFPHFRATGKTATEEGSYIGGSMTQLHNIARVRMFVMAVLVTLCGQYLYGFFSL